MSTYWASSVFVKTRGPRRRESATARSGTPSSEMRAVQVGPFRCVLAAADGDAALRAALLGLVGIWLWEGLYGCSFLAASLVQRRCVQKSSGGCFFGVLGVDGVPYGLTLAKKGFLTNKL